MTDRQRNRVYSWESQWCDWNTSTCSLRTARACVRWACELYGVKPPTVVRHYTKALSFSQGGKISFQAEQVNRAIALHEAAHHICDKMFDTEREHHSPEWLAIYLWLLIEARIAPRIAIIVSAHAWRLRWPPLWHVSPKRLAALAAMRHTKRQLTPPAR